LTATRVGHADIRSNTTLAASQRRHPGARKEFAAILARAARDATVVVAADVNSLAFARAAPSLAEVLGGALATSSGRFPVPSSCSSPSSRRSMTRIA
jgi:regulator of protease activity HflC (stomatin/prohibitin superfamily)